MKNLFKDILKAVILLAILGFLLSAKAPNTTKDVPSLGAPIDQNGEVIDYQYIIDPAGVVGRRQFHVMEGNNVYFNLSPAQLVNVFDEEGNPIDTVLVDNHQDLINLFDANIEAREDFVEFLNQNPNTAYANIVINIESGLYGQDI